MSRIPTQPPVEVFIFSRSFPPEIKEAYFPTHLIIPLSLDDVVGLWREEDFLLEDAAHSILHLICLSRSWTFSLISQIIAAKKSESFCGKNFPVFCFVFHPLCVILFALLNPITVRDLQDSGETFQTEVII